MISVFYCKCVSDFRNTNKNEFTKKRYKKLKNNKKITALAVSILLLFGTFLLPITKATETYITTEEIEDFSCIDDTYVSDIYPDTNYGSEDTWIAGDYIGSGLCFPYFRFNITEKPSDFIKVEVRLNIMTLGGLIIPGYVSNLTWTEDSITYNNRPTPDMIYLVPITIIYDIISCEVLIDITSYSNNNYISFALAMSGIDTYLVGYTKEHTNQDFIPSIVYTIEHEIVIPQNNEIVFLLIGLFLGLSIGLTIATIFLKKLSKIKSKF